MLEILFRGKRVDNGEWVYGGHVRLGGKFHYIVNGENRFVEHYVIPETVGQYTGLTDKNGQKIFEGDILKGFEYPFFRKEDGTHNYFAEVVWFDNSPAFGIYTFKNPESKVSGLSHGNTDYLEEFDSEIWEVIGNIHEQGVQ